MDMPRMKIEPVKPEEEMHPEPEEYPEPEALKHEQEASSQDLTVDDLQDIFYGRFYEKLIEAPGLQNLAKKQAVDLRRGLNFALVTEAYQKARDVELLSKPADHIAKTTMRTYEFAIGALTRTSENGCPYHQFAMLTHNGEWTSQTKKFNSKAGLNRRACRAIMVGFPLLIIDLASTYGQEKQLREEDARKIAGVLKRDYTSDFTRQLTQSVAKMDAEGILEFAKAVNYLNDFPPDIHGIRSREARKNGLSDKPAANSPPRRGTDSKKGTLSRVLTAEKQRQKRQPNFDWRTEFWAQTLKTTRTNDDRRAAFAVMIATGVRPVDLHRSVTVSVLKPSEVGNDRLLIRVNGTKLSDNSWAYADRSQHWRRNSDERDIVQKLMSDDEVLGFNDKGQSWRMFEIECVSDETQWLVGHVLRGGVTGLTTRSLSDAEQDIYGDYSGQILATKKVDLAYTPRRKMEPLELEKNATSAFNEQTQYIAKRVFKRLGGEITPYIFRHAISSDVKRRGDGGTAGSMLLGHAAGATAARYGAANQGRRTLVSRGDQITKSYGAKAIRSPHIPVTHTGSKNALIW